MLESSTAAAAVPCYRRKNHSARREGCETAGENTLTPGLRLGWARSPSVRSAGLSQATKHRFQGQERAIEARRPEKSWHDGVEMFDRGQTGISGSRWSRVQLLLPISAKATFSTSLNWRPVRPLHRARRRLSPATEPAFDRTELELKNGRPSTAAPAGNETGVK